MFVRLIFGFHAVTAKLRHDPGVACLPKNDSVDCIRANRENREPAHP
ncbi:MAG: hypothetical protein LBJ59_03895 [Zoogloeaceae bacterium]|jgi:hypothetical protein|nr:hypothetical protein [Zoogloeaceae bacterium]